MSVTSSTTFQHRIVVLRWALPVALSILAIVYETSLGRWIHDAIGAYLYFDLDIVFFATFLPIFVYIILSLTTAWFTKAEHAEHLAQSSERRLGTIMAASADAILSLDSTGKIDSWNRGAELMLGYTAAEARGKPLTLLLSGGEGAEVEYDWLQQRVREADFVRGHETTCRDADGRVVFMDLTATRLVDETEQYMGMSIILRDITERRYRDAEIRRLNANLSEQVIARTRELDQKVRELAQANEGLQALDRMRSEFVSLVSHQIRAPLTNMRGATERMRSDCGVINMTCTRMFTILDQQVNRLDRLVQGVLDTARIEAGGLVLQCEPISVLPIVQQVAEQTKARVVDRPIRLPTRPGLPLALADHDRVAEVLTNLLDNADKYAPPATEIDVDVLADVNDITVSVRDHGRGLPPAALEHIFDKFYRLDNSDSQTAYGYGLGLFVCRKLIEAQGGRIWAENATGGGARFSFTLPVAK